MPDDRNFCMRLSRNAKCRRLRRRHRRRDSRSIPGYRHCKNCSTPLHGMYCHKCGQYALDINQSFWAYIKQFLENAYQYDGRLVNTVRILFTRPGKLSDEFVVGRINSYVHPLKLYMFVNIIFFSFVLAFALDYNNDEAKTDKKIIKEPVANVLSPKDSLQTRETYHQIDSVLRSNQVANVNTVIDSVFQVNKKQEAVNNDSLIKETTENLKKEMFDELLSTVPFMMIFLIPVYGAILRVQYRKQRRKYLDCFVFALHAQSLLFILFAFVILQAKLLGYGDLNKVVVLGFLVYLVVASHNFFKVSWWKATRKALFGGFAYVLICAIVVAVGLLTKVILNHQEEVSKIFNHN